jgi:hypothetical protein
MSWCSSPDRRLFQRVDDFARRFFSAFLGAFLAAPVPCHVLSSKPGTAPTTVGSSGSACERVSLFDQRE